MMASCAECWGPISIIVAWPGSFETLQAPQLLENPGFHRTLSKQRPCKRLSIQINTNLQDFRVFLQPSYCCIPLSVSSKTHWVLASQHWTCRVFGISRFVLRLFTAYTNYPLSCLTFRESTLLRNSQTSKLRWINGAESISKYLCLKMLDTKQFPIGCTC